MKSLYRSIFRYLLKLLIGLFIIWIALKALIEAQQNERYVKQSFSSFENFWAKRNIKISMNLVREWVVEIIYIQNFLLVYGSLLLIFQQTDDKLFLSSGLIIQMIIMHNPFLFQQKYFYHFF